MYIVRGRYFEPDKKNHITEAYMLTSDGTEGELSLSIGDKVDIFDGMEERPKGYHVLKLKSQPFRSPFGGWPKASTSQMTMPDPTMDDWGVIADYDNQPTHIDRHCTLSEAMSIAAYHRRKKHCTRAAVVYLPIEQRWNRDVEKAKKA